MTLLLVAFAAFFLTEFVKTVAPALPPWAKMVLAYAVACLLTAGLNGWSDPENLAWALGGAGLAALVHKIHRWLSASGDGHQAAVMTMATRRMR